MTERKGAPLPLTDNGVSFQIGPFETLTLALSFRETDAWTAPTAAPRIAMYGM